MSGETVLIAEDDAAIGTVLARALARQEGYRIQATSVASVLRRWIADGDGDVVITDVALPDENSLDLLPDQELPAALAPAHSSIVMSAQNTLPAHGAFGDPDSGALREYPPKPFDSPRGARARARARTDSARSRDRD